MPFKPDPKIDLAEAQTVSLGGEQFFIPRLMLRQTKRIGPHLPVIIRLLTRMTDAATARAARLNAADEGEGTASGAGMTIEELEKLTFSEAEVDTMLGVVHVALTRAYPTLTREQLEDLPISVNELAAALPVAAIQSRTIVPAGDPAAGEAAS